MTKLAINTDRRSIGENVRRLRESAQLSQGQLAEQLGVSRATINRIEVSARHPEWELLCKMADFFEVSLDEFRA